MRRCGDLMAEATQCDSGQIQLALNQGEVVELDGSTLVVDGKASLSVLLRAGEVGSAGLKECRRSPECSTGRLG
jgi:hypothetical protein